MNASRHRITTVIRAIFPVVTVLGLGGAGAVLADALVRTRVAVVAGTCVGSVGTAHLRHAGVIRTHVSIITRIGRADTLSVLAHIFNGAGGTVITGLAGSFVSTGFFVKGVGTKALVSITEVFCA